jgi:hypothetical protein
MKTVFLEEFMKRGLGVFLLAALLCVPAGEALAQGGQIDGTVWKQLDINNKSLFTAGYFLGIQVFSKFAPSSCGTCEQGCMDEASSKLVPSGMSIPDVIKVIDSIYAEDGNKVIPVQYALNLVAKKAKGMSDEDFKAAVNDARVGSTPAAEAAPAEVPAPAKPPEK